MKLWHDTLRSAYSRPVTRLASFWKVVRPDSQVFGFTDHDQDVTIDGLRYRASLGLGVTSTQQTSDLQPATLDVSAFLDLSTEMDIEAGVWDESLVTAFEAPWDSPPAALDATLVNILLHGRLGRIERQTGRFTAQLHGLLEQLDTSIGRVFGPTCPWRLGDSRCGVNLALWTHYGTLTNLGPGDPRYAFIDDNSAQEAGYFNEGTITFTSGRNQGRTGDVRAFGDSGHFVLHRPLPYPAEVGDTYTAVRGDDKTWHTCVTVFQNVGRFGGFPFLPGPDMVLRNPLVKPVP